jgi:multiple sugar transport system permease protein
MPGRGGETAQSGKALGVALAAFVGERRDEGARPVTQISIGQPVGAQATAPPAVARVATRHQGRKRVERWVPLFFLLPLVVYILAMFAYPLAFGIIMSFEKFNFTALVKGSGPFDGVANYVAVFSDPTTRLAIVNTAIFTVASLVFQFVIGFLIALMFNRKFYLSGFLRGLLLIPWLLPLVASGTLFKITFSSSRTGLINTILLDLGLIHAPIGWLIGRGSALAAIILVNIWAGIPFNAILLHSGLQDVPVELYEAAKVDGAGALRRLFSVSIPMIKDVILIVLMLGLIYTVKAFDTIIVMTGGGPGNSTQLLSTWAYTQSFSVFAFGKGAAVGNILLVFCLIVALFYVKLSRRSFT